MRSYRRTVRSQRTRRAGQTPRVYLPVCRGRHNRASTGRHTGRDRNDSCTTIPAELLGPAVLGARGSGLSTARRDRRCVRDGPGRTRCVCSTRFHCARTEGRRRCRRSRAQSACERSTPRPGRVCRGAGRGHRWRRPAVVAHQSAQSARADPARWRGRDPGRRLDLHNGRRSTLAGVIQRGERALVEAWLKRKFDQWVVVRQRLTATYQAAAIDPEIQASLDAWLEDVAGRLGARNLAHCRCLVLRGCGWRGMIPRWR
jgi:hypothetical protein